MPGLDRTGPNSEGPKTGWGLGRCNPDTRDDIDEKITTPGRRLRMGEGWKGEARNGGRGLGRGRGRGRGPGRGRGRGIGGGRGR